MGSTAAYITRTHMIYSDRNGATQITLRVSSYIKATLRTGTIESCSKRRNRQFYVIIKIFDTNDYTVLLL